LLADAETQGVKMGRPLRYNINEEYPWRGVHSKAVNHCKGAKIPLTHKASEIRFTLDVRAFDDGGGFIARFSRN